MLAHYSKTVSIIYKDAEVVFLLKCNQLVQYSKSAGHSIYALCYKQHTAALLLCLLGCAGHNLLAINNVVVSIFHSYAHM